ncbi:unnamed protein product [Ceutorhynchus assimilis]|uniref:Gustatory receptor n=1 Tax=Ceutorhynchus assimilis TaxID=467358 RepID=A0A9N9QJZ9_9CUCU|nr:unnamed protein product [Ceutorhynchus assimilis]
MFENQLEKGYFMFSSGYILFKTGTVSLYAASINDASKSPAIYLNNVPSKYYNNEIRRLLIQISFDNVVLSGCKMFTITRGLLLNIASAIVAYELLLLQLTSMLLEDDKENRNREIDGPQL